MKNSIENQITKHSKSIGILQAIDKITGMIKKSGSDAVESNRLDRQRQILIDEYNSEIKTIWPFVLDESDPLKMDDLLVSPKIEKYLSARTINGLKHYFHLAGADPNECTIGAVLEIKPEHLLVIQNIGGGSVREFMDFQIKMKQ